MNDKYSYYFYIGLIFFYWGGNFCCKSFITISKFIVGLINSHICMKYDDNIVIIN